MVTRSVLAIADASRDGLELIQDGLQVALGDGLTARILLLSFLSVLSDKDLEPFGPNTLSLLIQEERDVVRSAKNHFGTTPIPCPVRFITGPAREEVLHEIENGNQDLIILQGRLVALWKETSRDFLRSKADRVHREICPVLVMSHGKLAFIHP